MLILCCLYLLNDLKVVSAIYKVLIVDDEELVRKDLALLINWEEYGFEVIGTAQNGRKALGIFVEKKPDILITDIKMPIMDGLELSSEALKIKPDLAILLLTAYDDSAYAIRALNLGVKRYLLKQEINSKKLLFELNQMKKEMESFKHLVVEYAAVEMVNMLTDRYDIVKFSLLLEKLDLDWNCMDFSFICISFEVLNGRSDIENKSLYKLKEEIEKAAEQSLQQGDRFIVLRIDLRRFSVLYCMPRRLSQLRQQEKTAFFSRKISDSLIDRNVGMVYTATSSVFSSISRAGYHFSEALEHLGISLMKCVARETGKLMNKYILSGDFDMASKFLQKKFLTMNTLQEAKIFSEELLFQFAKLLDDWRIDFDLASGSIQDINTDLHNVESPECLFERFKEVLRRIECSMASDSSKYSNKYVKDAERYIMENYNRNISLYDISDVLEISKNYLCSVFKKVTGMNLVTYLTKVRIENAKRLLSDTNKKVYMVADEVGFANVNYFSIIFKKHTGMTPNDYRNNED